MDQNNGGILGKINTPTTSVASGVWSLDSQFEAQSSSIWPLAFPQTTIANSCRFNSGSTDYLSKTFGTATNTKKFTWSFWVKRTKLGAGQYFFENVGSHTYQGSILFDSSDKLQLFEDNLGSGSGMYLITTQLFRDTSAWYHIVIAVDSTQSTASDRAKIYVNGVQVTSFSTSTYPAQDHALPYISGSGDPCNIGKYDNTNSNFDGYLTEVIFVDGQQLTPTSFGAFNPVTNIWEPIAYVGTYGNNGIKLNFTDSSNLGDDTSGNGNDFTVNNLTSIDQSTDTCSNNFATMNPLTIVAGASLTLSDGNLALNGNSTDAGAKSTFGVSSGKWYWEIKANKATSASDRLLVATENVRQITSATDPNSQGIWGIQSRSGTGATLNSYTNGTFSNGNSGSTGFNDNTIIGVALDVDNGKIYFHKDGTYTDLSGNTGNPADGTNPTFTGLPTDGTFLFPYVENRLNGTPSSQVNFGGAPSFAISSGNSDANGYGNFEYTVPSGYYALNSKNLAEYG